MIFWIVIVIFGIPLIYILLDIKNKKQPQDKELKKIQDRLAAKQKEAIPAKRKAIEEKHKNINS
ncbi:hypothetical protein ACJJIQ_02090 [Microbulbifer sp. ANSA003]|uniref:hypothetical protein n=1 Tax=Microbulbifer sp. ANSA003 TaxID=3243360 RepID=UPI0040419214